MIHIFKIHAPLDSNKSLIEMDGKRMEGVTRVEFAMGVKKLTHITLTILGEVVLDGEYQESDIVRVEREDEHPGMMRARVRRAFERALPGREQHEIGLLTDDVMRNFMPIRLTPTTTEC